jgi:hypothetical protein
MCFKPTKAVTWTTFWENSTTLTDANISAREMGWQTSSPAKLPRHRCFTRDRQTK